MWSGDLKSADALCLRIGKSGDKVYGQDARLLDRSTGLQMDAQLALRLSADDGCRGVHIVGDQKGGGKFDLHRCFGLSPEGKSGLLDPNAMPSKDAKLASSSQPAGDGDYGLCISMVEPPKGCKNPGLRLWQGKLGQGQEPKDLLSSEEFSLFEASCN